MINEAATANSSRITGVPPRSDGSCTGSTLPVCPVGVRRFYGRFGGRLSLNLAQTLANTLRVDNSSEYVL